MRSEAKIGDLLMDGVGHSDTLVTHDNGVCDARYCAGDRFLGQVTIHTVLLSIFGGDRDQITEDQCDLSN